jgi:hypothetical protein
MKITVIATGFDKEIAELVAPHATAAAGAQSRYTQSQDLSSRSSAPTRSDDLDVPTFIRKKAD